MAELLKGKGGVVTGGNKGRGRAIAAAAAEGATLVIGGRTEKDGQAVPTLSCVHAGLITALGGVASLI